MSFNLKERLERIFRESTSAEELFDMFQKALELKLKDLELYKILLGNFALSVDEIKMFTEKLCSEFKEFSYDLYMWTGNIIENMHDSFHIEDAFIYYKKAMESKKEDCQPYFSIVRMYNPDLDIPPKMHLLALFDQGMNEVAHKSRLCQAIAEFYTKIEDIPMKNRYLALAAKFARAEHNKG